MQRLRVPREAAAAAVNKAVRKLLRGETIIKSFPRVVGMMYSAAKFLPCCRVNNGAELFGSARAGNKLLFSRL